MPRLLFALVAGLMLLARPGLAARLDDLSRKVSYLDSAVRDLDQRLRPPAEPRSEMAERRLIDGQVLYQLKNYESAAILLLDVVQRYPHSSAYPDAIFYLGDALYLNQDYLSSGRYFHQIASLGPRQPHYIEALERLVELSLRSGDYSAIEPYIRTLEAAPAGARPPAAAYVQGKYYFFRRDYDQAIASLKTVLPGPYHLNALYILGASYVGRGPASYDAALQAFGELAATSPKNAPETRAVELAHLARARIFLQRGQLQRATTEYLQVKAASGLFNDALYENAWVAIQAKDYKSALNALDLLVLNSPQSQLAPEVKLLMGSLRLRQQDYGPAMDQFSRTRDEYEPLQRRLSAEVAKPDEMALLTQMVAENLQRPELTPLLPEATRFLKDEPSVARIQDLVSDQKRLRISLRENGELIKRLERALHGPARINVFPELARARASSVAISNELVGIKKQLADDEARLLAAAAGADGGELTRLSSTRRAVEERLAALPTTLDALNARVRKQRADYDQVDRKAAELQAAINASKAQMAALRTFYTEEIEETLTEARRVDAMIELDSWSAYQNTLQQRLETIRKDTADSAAGAGVDDPDMQTVQQLKRQQDDLIRRQRALARRIAPQLGAGERGRVEEIEGVLDRVQAVDARIVGYESRIEGILGTKLADMEAAVASEKVQLGHYQQQLAGYTGDTSDVGGPLLEETLRSVARRYYNIVVRSDVGVIDVSWALKDTATKETNRLMTERKRELKLLDDEFKDVLKDQP